MNPISQLKSGPDSPQLLRRGEEAAGTYLTQVRTAIEWLHPGGAHESVLTIRSFGRRQRRMRCGGR